MFAIWLPKVRTIIQRIQCLHEWFLRNLSKLMPKDYLFPPLLGASRKVTLSANSPLNSGMLGAIVKLSGFTLNLSGISGYGFFVAIGPGNLTGAVVATLTANQAVFLTLTDGAIYVVDQPDLDLAAMTAHLASTANPHATTKAQVGLGSVDNTADSAKPVSTAQAAAIQVAKDAAIASASATATAKVNTAKSNTIGIASADATAKANTAQTNAYADATSKANSAQAAAIAAASADATAKANTAQAAAISQAATDAAILANAAQAAAVATASADATAKAGTAQAAAAAYTDSAVAALSVSGTSPSAILRSLSQGPPDDLSASLTITDTSGDYTLSDQNEIGVGAGGVAFASAAAKAAAIVTAVNGNAAMAFTAVADAATITFSAKTSNPATAYVYSGASPVLFHTLTAGFIGQQCRYGDASPFDWYLWDGTAWIHTIDTTP